MKKITSLLLVSVILMSLISTTFAAGKQKADVWTSDWREQVFPDTEKPAGIMNPLSITLYAAQNSVEAFQVNIRAPKEGNINSVTFSDLSCGSETISNDCIEYQYVDYITAAGRNGEDGNSKYVEGWDDATNDYIWTRISNPVKVVSPGTQEKFPEILTPASSRWVFKNNTQSIWIKVHIPSSVVPGKYCGTSTINTSAWGTYTVDIELNVMDVKLPNASDADAFSIEMWSQLVGNFDTDIDVICDAFDVEVGSAEWWSVMRSFADLMKQDRMNVLIINPIALLLQGNTTVSEDGVISFDWTFFDQFIGFYLQNAGIQQLAGGQLAKFKTNPMGWTDEDYSHSYIECIVRGADGAAVKELILPNPENWATDADSLKAKAYLEQYLPALYEHLQEKGWLNLWYQHIIDEPGQEHSRALYPILKNLITVHCPGVKTGDAMSVLRASQLQGNIDNWIIMEDTYEQAIEEMESYRKAGDRLWLYTSCQPLADDYLNRTIDKPVWNMEMIAYLCYLRGATGYLHWGLNQWNTWATNYSAYPNYLEGDWMYDNALGDASCVYPDKANLSIRDSIRTEAIREASELYELLRLAAEKDFQATQSVVQSMIRSGNDYETDIPTIASAKITLLQIAAE